MNIEQLHIIKGDDINIVYHSPSLKIMVVSDLLLQVVESLKGGLSVQEICMKNESYKDDILSFVGQLEALSNEILLKEQLDKDKRVVHRITLHVSNDCNLRCKYCYAGGGNYSQERSLMNMRTAVMFMDFCMVNFDQIDEIAFFGGEPMLNLEVMEYICDQFKTYYMEGKSSFIPRFGIITNGTILSPRVIRFVRNHISSITVSIDGTKEMNDVNRVYRNGKGSYNRIANFIHTLLNETNVPIRYEATFTKHHLDMSVKKSDIHEFFEKEFGIDGVIVVENGLKLRSPMDYWNNIDYDSMIATDFQDMPDGFWEVLNVIVHKKEQEMCPLVKGIFAVGADGSIYPCHMLNGVKENCLGNIAGEHIFNTPLHNEAWDFMLQLKQNDRCEKCWGKNFCGGCTIKRFYDDTSKRFLKYPTDKLCDFVLEYYEHMLLLIVSIRKNPVLWEALVERVNKRFADFVY